jgi:hypothetical protein
MVGHHSMGEAARHKLITVAEAFKGVNESAQAKDPLLEARKQKINQQVGAVVERAKAVETNAQDIQMQLEDIYKRALADLKSITKKKLNILKGDMIELHREQTEINQLERFLDYQSSGGNATQFILDWGAHQRLRGELHAFAHFRETIDVLPDIKINGGIQVHIEAAGPMPYSYASSTSTGGAVGGGNADDNSMATMRASTLFPRYATGGSPCARSRQGTPTVDFSILTKTTGALTGRKPNEMDSAALFSGNAANGNTVGPLGKM